MKKKCLFLLWLIFGLMFSSGCWDQRELNDLAIAMALGFDKADDLIEVSIQVVIPQEVKEPSYYTPVTNYSKTAESVFEAFRKMTTESPRKIYLPHFRIMVISEELAREGITDILDMLIRDHEFRSDFYLGVARGDTKAKDILKIMTPLEKIPANEKFSSLQTSEAAWAPTVAVLLDDLLNDLITEGKEAVLTGIMVTGDLSTADEKANVEQIEPNSLLRWGNIAVFKGDKVVGWLNEEESKGYNYIMGNVNNTVGRVPCPNGGEVVLEVKSSNVEVIPRMKNGQPEIEIEIVNNVNIGEVICDIDLNNPDAISDLEKNIEKRVEEILDAAIQAAQEKFNSDIFGFGNAIYKKFPKQWKQQFEPTWKQDGFQNLQVTYSIDTTVEHSGTLTQSFYSKLKELD